MKNMNRMLALAGVAVALCWSPGNVAAQGRGNFDPAAMRQRMLDDLKERMEVTNDAEWKLISERIEKVMDAQRETRMGGGMFGRGGRRGGGDNAGGDGGDRPARPNPFTADNPDRDALQKAVDGKASSDELKGKMAKLRATIKEKEANLVKAQDELKKVLSVRQEAVAVLAGLLK